MHSFIHFRRFSWNNYLKRNVERVEYSSLVVVFYNLLKPNIDLHYRMYLPWNLTVTSTCNLYVEYKRSLLSLYNIVHPYVYVHHKRCGRLHRS